MLLESFFSKQADQIHYSRQQASDFAKEVAGDFNLIHDVDAKMFCVPGDLLFATVLSQHGLSKKMCFTFSGMVTDGIKLDFTASNAALLTIKDENDKEYLSVEREGEISHDQALIANLAKSYVAFSGQTFPHILVPLMKEQGVMINPARPLVVYQNMAIELDTLDISNPVLEASDSTLEVNGKRGSASLKFNITESGEVVGHGKKTIVLSGLREYDQVQIDELVASYNARKQAYQSRAA
ncbi:MAG: DUF3581 domain-containing protein [Gammaproteobacteria bacterium]|nr:DUF3581 domain-containing protein [Gammaproteobacteria bacterium]